MGEGIAIDAAGNIFTAEATVRGVTKYVNGLSGLRLAQANGRRAGE